jgi:hypothetical protein
MKRHASHTSQPMFVTVCIITSAGLVLQRVTTFAQSFSLQHFRAMGAKQSTSRLSTRLPVDPAPAPPSPRVPSVQFRVLIIGRANAGKTSILQRVCDTTESPVIYRSGPSGTREQVCPHSQRRIQSHHDPSRLNSNPQ